ncbi:MAG: TatD family hydrolase [Desulfobacterales bacterium]|nr:TatD family hydrolase [Desulfobacterales bacterium]
MPFIDSHCHLHDHRIIQDIPHLLDRARAAGVTHMVTCATMESNFYDTQELAQFNPPILACFGIHPWFLDSLTPGWKRMLAAFLANTPSGVGETGLDFMDRGADRDLQLEVFKTHLTLAQNLGRPINIHIRKAWDALIHILKKNGPLTTPGLIHSFSGSADLVPVLEKYNLYLSFSGASTRPNAKKTHQALAAVSPDRILFETDAPDLYPSLAKAHPLHVKNTREAINEPALVAPILALAAEKRGQAVEELTRMAYDNAQAVFAPLLT